MRSWLTDAHEGRERATRHRSDWARPWASCCGATGIPSRPPPISTRTPCGRCGCWARTSCSTAMSGNDRPHRPALRPPRHLAGVRHSPGERPPLRVPRLDVQPAQGQVVDMPFEPACLPLKITAYPVAGAGRPDLRLHRPRAGAAAPALGRARARRPEPNVGSLDAAAATGCSAWTTRWTRSTSSTCTAHYGNYVMKRLGKPRAWSTPRSTCKIDFDVFEYGIYKRRLVEGEPEDVDDWTIGHPILFPNILAQGSADRRQQLPDPRARRRHPHPAHINYNGATLQTARAPAHGRRQARAAAVRRAGPRHRDAT